MNNTRPVTKDEFFDAQINWKGNLKRCFYWLDIWLDNHPDFPCMDKMPKEFKEYGLTPIDLIAIAHHIGEKVEGFDKKLSKVVSDYINSPESFMPPDADYEKATLRQLQLLNHDKSWNERPPYEPPENISEIVKEEFGYFLEGITQTKRIRYLFLLPAFNAYLKDIHIDKEHAEIYKCSFGEY